MQRNVAEKKILARNWGLKKNSCTEKLPNPPLKYLMVRPLGKPKRSRQTVDFMLTDENDGKQ